MIVGLKIIDDFEVDDVEDLVKRLTERKLIDYSFEEVKKLFGKDFDDVCMNDDSITYVLEDLANGNFYWEYHDDVERFTIFVVDSDNPYTISGNSKKKTKVKVSFD